MRDRWVGEVVFFFKLNDDLLYVCDLRLCLGLDDGGGSVRIVCCFMFFDLYAWAARITRWGEEKCFNQAYILWIQFDPSISMTASRDCDDVWCLRHRVAIASRAGVPLSSARWVRQRGD